MKFLKLYVICGFFSSCFVTTNLFESNKVLYYCDDEFKLELKNNGNYCIKHYGHADFHISRGQFIKNGDSLHFEIGKRLMIFDIKQLGNKDSNSTVSIIIEKSLIPVSLTNNGNDFIINTPDTSLNLFLKDSVIIQKEGYLKCKLELYTSKIEISKNSLANAQRGEFDKYNQFIGLISNDNISLLIENRKITLHKSDRCSNAFP